MSCLQTNVAFGQAPDGRVDQLEWPLLAGSRHRPPQLTFVRGDVSFLDVQQAGVDPKRKLDDSESSRSA